MQKMNLVKLGASSIVVAIGCLIATSSYAWGQRNREIKTQLKTEKAETLGHLQSIRTMGSKRVYLQGWDPSQSLLRVEVPKRGLVRRKGAGAMELRLNPDGKFSIIDTNGREVKDVANKNGKIKSELRFFLNQLSKNDRKSLRQRNGSETLLSSLNGWLGGIEEQMRNTLPTPKPSILSRFKIWKRTKSAEPGPGAFEPMGPELREYAPAAEAGSRGGAGEYTPEATAEGSRGAE
jgi:hypothetical protein